MPRYLIASDSKRGTPVKTWPVADATDEHIEQIKAEYEASVEGGRQVSFVVVEGETLQDAMFPRRPGA